MTVQALADALGQVKPAIRVRNSGRVTGEQVEILGGGGDPVSDERDKQRCPRSIGGGERIADRRLQTRHIGIEHWTPRRHRSPGAGPNQGVLQLCGALTGETQRAQSRALRADHQRQPAPHRGRLSTVRPSSTGSQLSNGTRKAGRRHGHRCLRSRHRAGTTLRRQHGNGLAARPGRRCPQRGKPPAGRPAVAGCPTGRDDHADGLLRRLLPDSRIAGNTTGENPRFRGAGPG